MAEKSETEHAHTLTPELVLQKKIDKIVRPLVNLTKGKYRDDPDEKNSRWNGRDYKKQWGHLECHHVVL